MPDQEEVPFSRTGMFARFYWICVGDPLLLLLLVVMIAKHPKLPSLLDAAYVAALGSLILVRYADTRFLKGQTGEGQPATMAHWRRYAMLMGSAWVGAWLVARVWAHFLD
jgi:hypothetical protein